MTDITLPRSVVELAIEAMRKSGEQRGSTASEFNAIEALLAALDQPQVNSPEIPEGWRLVPVEPTDDMLYDIQEYSHILPPRGKRIWAHMLAAAPQPPVVEHPQSVTDCHQSQPKGEQEPDWTNSETGLLECWKNPMHTMPDRLQMADGAVAFRDKTIANLRVQIEAYQSAQQLPTAEQSSAVQPQGAQEPVAYYVERHAPGRRDHGMKLGPFWKREDAEGWLDEHHQLHALYAHPQPKRQPLTDEQWLKRWTGKTGQRLKPGPERDRLLRRFRFAERAHGIGGEL